MKVADVFTRTLAGLSVTLLLCGCTTGAGGGGGGGGDGDGGDGGTEDPLPQYQLGQDEELDANVGAITAADNAAVVCLQEEFIYDEEGVLLSLKQGYVADTSVAPSFPEFVADLVELEQAKSTEICDTTLENASQELLDLVARLTAARNRGRECRGEDPTLTDENSLLLLKKEFFARSVRTFPTLLEFADLYVEDAEQVAEDECT